MNCHSISHYNKPTKHWLYWMYVPSLPQQCIYYPICALLGVHWIKLGLTPYGWNMCIYAICALLGSDKAAFDVDGWNMHVQTSKGPRDISPLPLSFNRSGSELPDAGPVDGPEWWEVQTEWQGWVHPQTKSTERGWVWLMHSWDIVDKFDKFEIAECTHYCERAESSVEWACFTGELEISFVRI